MRFFIYRYRKSALNTAHQIQQADQHEIRDYIGDAENYNAAFQIQVERGRHLAYPYADGEKELDSYDNQHAVMRKPVAQWQAASGGRHVPPD